MSHLSMLMVLFPFRPSIVFGRGCRFVKWTVSSNCFKSANPIDENGPTEFISILPHFTSSDIRNSMHFLSWLHDMPSKSSVLPCSLVCCFNEAFLIQLRAFFSSLSMTFSLIFLPPIFLEDHSCFFSFNLKRFLNNVLAVVLQPVCVRILIMI